MGLLDRAEEINKTSEAKVSSSPTPKKESPSLLKKAEHFREEELPNHQSLAKSVPVSDSDSDWAHCHYA